MKLGLDEAVKIMNFEDALRKVINESDDNQLDIAKRASYEYIRLPEFLEGKRKLYDTEMQRLYDALNDIDREKWRRLIIDRD